MTSTPTYLINGHDLNNEALGWRLLRDSQVLGGVTKVLSNVTVPGRNGVIQGVPSRKGAPVVTMVVMTSGKSLEDLYALFEKNGGVGTFQRAGDTTRQAIFELASISSSGINASDGLIKVSIAIRFPSGDWRDTALTTTGPTTVTTPVQDFSVLAGISSDISDASFFLAGNWGNFQLTDLASGSWVKTIKTLSYTAGSGLLYVGTTGQAFRATTAAPWTPTSEVSDYIDVSGGGGFRITSSWTSDPASRSAALELTTTSQTSVALSVRTYNAYSLRADDL